MDDGLMLGLRGKRALVTGGSRGIGRATALLLAQAGAQLGIAYRSRARDAEEVVAAIRAGGGMAWAEAADLGASGGADRLLERAAAEWDGLDILIANAGVWPPEDVPLERMSPTQWEHTVRVNLGSLFPLLAAAIPMIGRGGRIVLVSSTAGQRGEAFHSDYAASKGAVIALTKSVAVELAPREITVNCVAPGWVDTEMAAAPLALEGRARIERDIPLGRVATAEEIAGPILFLCSTLARHITGEVLNVNGGSVLCG